MAFNLEISYEDTNDQAINVYGASYAGQTFVTGTGFTLTKFGFYGTEIGTIPADMKLAIYATSGGLPTGSPISSSTVPPADVSGSIEWQEFELDDPVALSGSTTYAWVFQNPNGDASNTARFYRDATSPSYAGGSYVASSNSGSSWTANTARDCTFRLYSGGSGTPVDVSVTVAVVSGVTINADTKAFKDVSLTITAASAVSVSTVQVNTVKGSGGAGNVTKQRLISVGNNAIYYEDV